LIDRIAGLLRQYYKDDIQPPATEEALDFLRVTDGLNWDGLFIYASASDSVDGNPAVLIHSFVVDNLDWRSYERRRNCLIFADSDISLYALNLVIGRYEVQDRSSGTVMETFDVLITEALRLCLHEGEEEDMEEEDEEVWNTGCPELSAAFAAPESGNGLPELFLL
jgi:hypothetical protein